MLAQSQFRWNRPVIPFPAAADGRSDRFVTNGAENILAIESKSHFAGDQNDQVHDYLVHLGSAYPHASVCRLYYLKNGKAPDVKSILTAEWNRRFRWSLQGVQLPCCHVSMVGLCRKQLTSSKIRIFLTTSGFPCLKRKMRWRLGMKYARESSRS